MSKPTTGQWKGTIIASSNQSTFIPLPQAQNGQHPKRTPLPCQLGRRGVRGRRKGSQQCLPQCDPRNVIFNPAAYNVDIYVSFQHIKLEIIFIHDLPTVAYMRLIFETSKKLDTFVKVGNCIFKRCSIQQILAYLLCERGTVLC